MPLTLESKSVEQPQPNEREWRPENRVAWLPILLGRMPDDLEKLMKQATKYPMKEIDS